MNFVPFGITRSDPPMPTGTMTTPVRIATYAAPSNKGCTTGPLLRSPSGNSTSGSPPSITAMQRLSASRSALPRLTGKPPRALSRLPKCLLLHHLSAPMKRIRRRYTPDATGVSMMLRCVGARMNGPLVGMLSRPSMDMRHHTRQKTVTMVRTVWYAILSGTDWPASLVETFVTGARALSRSALRCERAPHRCSTRWCLPRSSHRPE